MKNSRKKEKGNAKGVQKEGLNVYILLDDIRSIMFDEKLYNKVIVTQLMHSAPDIISYEKGSMETIMLKIKTSGLEFTCY